MTKDKECSYAYGASVLEGVAAAKNGDVTGRGYEARVTSGGYPCYKAENCPSSGLAAL